MSANLLVWNLLGDKERLTYFRESQRREGCESGTLSVFLEVVVKGRRNETVEIIIGAISVFWEVEKQGESKRGPAKQTCNPSVRKWEMKIEESTVK